MSTMITITVVPADAMHARSTPGAGSNGLTRLWRSLIARWTGRMERQIEADLHGSIILGSEMITGARLVADRTGRVPSFPLTADLAGLLAMAARPSGRADDRERFFAWLFGVCWPSRPVGV